MEIIIDILNQIRPEIDFSKSSNYVEEGILDSLDIIRLVAELDEKFAISISGSEIIPENFKTIESIKALVQKSDGKI